MEYPPYAHKSCRRNFNFALNIHSDDMWYNIYEKDIILNWCWKSRRGMCSHINKNEKRLKRKIIKKESFQDKTRHFSFLPFENWISFLCSFFFQCYLLSIHFLILLISFISLQRQMKIIWGEKKILCEALFLSFFFDNNRLILIFDVPQY